MTRVAVTGGRGFVGSEVVRQLRGADVAVVVVARPGAPSASDTVAAAVTDVEALTRAFDGCEAVVLCAGINHERGRDTYDEVHIRGTAAAIEAARHAAVRRLILVSFLRARPDGPSPYHRSKWAAEQLLRASGLEWTAIRPGVIFGRGDHLLDHLSRAFHTFPMFGLVGRAARGVRPVAVADVARVLVAAAAGDERLRDRTIHVLGPERLTLEAAVRRVADVVGRRPWLIPVPVAAHRLLARGWEAVMDVPLVARAQVEILADGLDTPLADSEPPPVDLRPTTRFDEHSIRRGIPEPSAFGPRDLRPCAWLARARAGAG
jgi:NADH dehydrogenase